MSRKITFKLLLTSFLAFTLTKIFAQSGKAVYTFPLGLQTYTYRNMMPKNVVGTLDLIKSLGFKEIESGTPKGMTTEEYKKLLD